MHPRRVARLVEAVNGTDDMIAAALLHDVVEDTRVKHDHICDYFGGDIANLVFGLTHASKKSDGNRAKRKAIDLAFLATESPEVHTIKLADLIDNTSTIVEHDPEFAKVYMKEKRDLIKVLQSGNDILLDVATSLVDDYFKLQTELSTF